MTLSIDVDGDGEAEATLPLPWVKKALLALTGGLLACSPFAHVFL